MSAIPLQNTPDWLEWRRGGVGASELPAILGEDPWKGEYQLALEKRGELAPEPQNEAQAWGHRVQRSALELYAERQGVKVRQVNTTVVSRRFPHVYASLDGRVVGERRGVEVKLTGQRWDDDEPPRRVQIQCQAQMGVCGLDAIDVVKVGMHYSPPRVYTVERNDMAIAKLLALGEAWYLRFVKGDELPPVDGSKAASRHLDGIHGEPEMKADIDQAALAARLQAVRRTLKAAEAEESDIVNLLKASMAGAYALIGSGFKVAWKPSKPRETTDWKGVAKAYRLLLQAQVEDVEMPDWLEAMGGARLRPDTLDAVESMHTSTSEGTRPFRVTFEEGTDD